MKKTLWWSLGRLLGGSADLLQTKDFLLKHFFSSIFYTTHLLRVFNYWLIHSFDVQNSIIK